MQFRIESAQALDMSAESKLPKGWQVAGQTSGGEGVQIVTVSTPRDTQQGNVDINLKFSNGTNIETQIAVVRQVGRH